MNGLVYFFFLQKWHQRTAICKWAGQINQVYLGHIPSSSIVWPRLPWGHSWWIIVNGETGVQKMCEISSINFLTFRWWGWPFSSASASASASSFLATYKWIFVCGWVFNCWIFPLFFCILMCVCVCVCVYVNMNMNIFFFFALKRRREVTTQHVITWWRRHNDWLKLRGRG